MTLIVTHEQPDFDALASLALAQRLHPSARVVLHGGLTPEVRACMRLYRDRLDPLEVGDALERGFNALVVVDTADRSRLGPFADRLHDASLTVYDHHPRPTAEDALPAGRGLVDAVGATVTLLVRELRRRDDELPPELASLALLGLHEDTGGFSFDLTTAEDHDAGAWLLRCGGTLELVRRFARGAHSAEHDAFRSRLLAEARIEDVAGRPVAVSAFDWPRYLADVAGFANELLALHRADAALVVVRMEERSYVFARASGAIDVGAALRDAVDGGGHAGAAFARSEAAPFEVERDVLRAFARHARPPLRARELMSTPVRTVAPEATLHEASELLLRYGHNGLPVVEAGTVVGVLSRRDVERALEHGLGRSHVRGFMGRPAVTAAPDATVDALETLVADRNLGRVPIVEDGRLVGIVTRTDLLGAMHRAPPADDPAASILARLPDQAWRAVRVLGDALPEGAALYLVGGSVRDALLGTTLIDLDLAVEGAEPNALARALREALGGEQVSHESFGTASVRLPGGLPVDLALAREERYSEPGALPEVVPSDVRRDLGRRDFTINALACRLLPEPLMLLDPFGGLPDLRAERLRTLHPLSFVEDPTRIVRGVRLAARLGFSFDEASEAQARDALATGAADRVSAERLRTELELTLTERQPSRALALLAELDGLRRGYGLGHPGELLAALDTLRDEGREVPAAAYVLALLLPLARDEREAAVTRFRWPKRRSVTAARVTELRDGAPPTDGALEAVGRAGRALLEAHGGGLRERVRAFESLAGRRRLRGQDVIGLGLPPGPDVGRVLDDVATARHQGRVHGFEQELELARTLVRRALAERERQDEAT